VHLLFAGLTSSFKAQLATHREFELWKKKPGLQVRHVWRLLQVPQLESQLTQLADPPITRKDALLQTQVLESNT
jgi:hypothetical protein